MASTRLATPSDAPAAVEVVRQSIIVSCVLDHQHDGPTLERWLANKTPEHFIRWCADPESRLIVALTSVDASIAGVASLHCSGELRLCYVGPDFARAGAGRALLLAVEAHARDWNITTLRLRSTRSARPFYEACGFTAAGEASPAFGVLVGYPYTKALAAPAFSTKAPHDELPAGAKSKA